MRLYKLEEGNQIFNYQMVPINYIYICKETYRGKNRVSRQGSNEEIEAKESIQVKKKSKILVQ